MTEHYIAAALRPAQQQDRLSTDAKLLIAWETLQRIEFGLTNGRNCLWQTQKRWTKLQRDAAILDLVRNTLRQINAAQ